MTPEERFGAVRKIYKKGNKPKEKEKHQTTSKNAKSPQIWLRKRHLATLMCCQYHMLFSECKQIIRGRQKLAGENCKQRLSKFRRNFSFSSSYRLFLTRYQ
jgi:hypothetical protein